MNVKLRQRHRYIWMVMGMALPLLCLEAIEQIPANPLARIPINICPVGIVSCGFSEYDEVHFLALDVFKIEITEYDSTALVSIDFSVPLKSAFTIAYYSPNEQIDNQSIALGSIQGMGSYRFNLRNDWPSKDFNIIIKDVLKNKIIHTERFIISK
jgi:hypothetical protein